VEKTPADPRNRKKGTLHEQEGLAFLIGKGQVKRDPGLFITKEMRARDNLGNDADPSYWLNGVATTNGGGDLKLQAVFDRGGIQERRARLLGTSAGAGQECDHSGSTKKKQKE